MKKFLIFGLLILAVFFTTGHAFAGVEDVLNEIGEEASPLFSYIYWGFFALTCLSAVGVAFKMQTAGSLDITKLITIICVTVLLLVCLYFINETIAPKIMEQAQQASTLKVGWN